MMARGITAGRHMGRGAASAGVAVATLLTGCAGHFAVRPATQASDPGFRYYLPVPYLVVTNMTLGEQATAGKASASPSASDATAASAETKAGDGSGKEAEPVREVLTSKIVWLPDLATPYTITTKGGGIGSFKGTIQLANGWMLTGVNQESDAKVAETLSALSGLVGSAATAGAAGFAAPHTVERKRHPAFLLLFKIDTKANTLTAVRTDELKQELAAAMAGETTP